MSQSESESSSSTTTTTQQYDQRVGAEGGAIAIGSGAQISINEEFGSNVAQAFNQLISLARDAGQLVDTLNKTTQDTTTKAVDLLAKQVERSEKGASTIYTDIFPYVAAAIIGIVAIFIFINFSKRKR